MLKKVVGLLIFFSPFTSYFAVSAWLRLPVILTLLASFIFALYVILSGKFKLSKLVIKQQDVLLFILLIVIWFSYFVGFRESRSLNHTLAYTFTFIFYYFVIRLIINYININPLYILRMFSLSAIVCSIIIIVDWVLINFLSVGIRDYFVNTDNNTANMLYYIKSKFFTVGGVAEEPGSMALFMNIIGPLGILYYYLQSNFSKARVVFILYITAMFCLFSTAGFLNVLIALGVLFLYSAFTRHQLKLRSSYLIYTFVSILLTLVVLIIYKEQVSNLAIEISQKIFLDSNNESASVRAQTWTNSFKDWLVNPFFGYGPGYGVEKYSSGYHSVYLTILADIGIIGFILFTAFIILNFVPVLKLNATEMYLIGVPFIATIIHFAIVGDFFHAPFWLLLIFIQIFPKTSNSLVADK